MIDHSRVFVHAKVNIVCSSNTVFCPAVQGNAGPEIDRRVRVDLVNLRTVHMEYDPCSVSASFIDV